MYNTYTIPIKHKVVLEKRVNMWVSLCYTGGTMM